MTSWTDRVGAIGLVGDAAGQAAQTFAALAERASTVFDEATPSLAWWIPGRLEVLGKHTDYGGGRSLLCAVERGFHVLASARDDRVVHLVDGSTGASLTLPLQADAEPKPGHWSDYPITVIRRVARDFPSANVGMNIMLRSTLPSASGLSSSSALVIACFLPLARFNQLDTTATWQSEIGDPDALAGYLGAMENGRRFGQFDSDRGVGTQGGSEDQTAIIRAVRGHLLQYHFMPVTRERVVALPTGWRFAIAMSGVHAAKGAAVQARYNALADQVARLLATWDATSGRADPSLFQALASTPDAGDRLAQAVAASGRPDTAALRARLTQFRTETESIIPTVATRLAAGDVAGLREPVALSQSLAESTLGNQIPETSFLARRAPEIGAAAASAFGAGFGGSVWALVRETEMAGFLSRWRSEYLDRFPGRRHRAEFFSSGAGPAATEL
ncbi:MAG: galactokinase family protein [Gemmatimonadales bacterium]